jgi:hypothetical protein
MGPTCYAARLACGHEKAPSRAPPGEWRENAREPTCGRVERFWKGFGKVSSVADSGIARNSLTGSGGRDRDRTCDPYHVKVVLYR